MLSLRVLVLSLPRAAAFLQAKRCFPKREIITDNAALPIYNKYYKRCAARVKVRQIKEDEFKKWKYVSLIKRDECSDGLITPQKFTDWLEQCFSNRKKPTKKQ